MNTDWLAAERQELERRLSEAVPGADEPPQALHRAIRYSVLSGGKRLRPLLVRAAARAVAGEDCEAAWAPALAVECIHTYSLIHDDLPALDNDDLRRGQPTCHKKFGEATAILAGDALLTRAFGLLAASGAGAAAMANALAAAAGTPAGMIAGQMGDLEAERRTLGLVEVRAIHVCKTAALLRASVELGGLAAGASPAQMRALTGFGSAIGLAFQVADDVLDAAGDAAAGKPSYAVALGVKGARAEARRLLVEARAAIADWPAAAGRLRVLAEMLVNRVN